MRLPYEICKVPVSNSEDYAHKISVFKHYPDIKPREWKVQTFMVLESKYPKVEYCNTYDADLDIPESDWLVLKTFNNLLDAERYLKWLLDTQEPEVEDVKLYY